MTSVVIAAGARRLSDQKFVRVAYPPGPSPAATTSDVRPRVVTFIVSSDVIAWSG
jgi:hypothetical protein